MGFKLKSLLKSTFKLSNLCSRMSLHPTWIIMFCTDGYLLSRLGRWYRMTATLAPEREWTTADLLLIFLMIDGSSVSHSISQSVSHSQHRIKLILSDLMKQSYPSFQFGNFLIQTGTTSIAGRGTSWGAEWRHASSKLKTNHTTRILVWDHLNCFL